MTVPVDAAQIESLAITSEESILPSTDQPQNTQEESVKNADTAHLLLNTKPCPLETNLLLRALMSLNFLGL